MNHQESLIRLEKEKNRLKDELGDDSPLDSFNSSKQLIKKKIRLFEELIKGYSQSGGEEEADTNKVDQEFSKVYGFTEQKKEVKGLLLLQKSFKAENIEIQEKRKSFCFVGPPGVGKTYFASKFAKALGRKFFQVNLGGAGRAITITGGEEMWVGAEPGGIIKGIMKTQTCNPVILLDEVEKSGRDDRHGSIEDALLHVLDPEQNQHFTDQFLNVEIDISRIVFILTANELEKISEPLKDRLEIIELKAYNKSEKLQICKITIERIFQEDYKGNKSRNLFEMSDETLNALISKTEEKGVRQLESRIRKIVRWCFIQWAQQLENGEQKSKIVIDEDKVNEIIFKDSEKKEDSEEDKLKKDVEELKKENEKLKTEPTLILPFGRFALNGDSEQCDKCSKITCQTTQETCAICQLNQQFQQFESLIDEKNEKAWREVWIKQKAEWKKQIEKLQQSESGEEKELAEKIKEVSAKISQKLMEVRQKSGRKNDKTTTNKKLSADWPWILGGGIVLVLIGGAYGWFLSKIFKKKKKTEFWQDSHWKKPAETTFSVSN